MAPGHEIAIRAVGTALAGMSTAFAIYMLAYGGGGRASTDSSTWRSSPSRAETRAERLRPRASLRRAQTPPALSTWRRRVRSPPPPARPRRSRRPIEIVAARADRVWLRIDGALRSAVPGDTVPGVGRIGAIVARDGGWALLDDKGAALLAVTKGANGAALFARNRIFE